MEFPTKGTSHLKCSLVSNKLNTIFGMEERRETFTPGCMDITRRNGIKIGKETFFFNSIESMGREALSLTGPKLI